MQQNTLPIFSVTAAIKQGWQLFTLRPWFYASTAALFFIINIVIGILSGAFDSFIITVITYILSIWISLGIIRFYVKAVDLMGGNVTVRDLFMEYRPIIWLRYFICTILASLAVLCGFILLIIPGLYVASRLSLVNYLLVEKRETIFGALKTSWRLTKGYGWKLVGLMLLSGLIMILGLLLLGIGLFVAMPVLGLTYAYVYKLFTLKQETIEAVVQ